MRDRCRALATRSLLMMAVVVVLVGLAMVQTHAQQPQQPRPPRKARSPIRDQGGVPLKKPAKPEAADPLAKGGIADAALTAGTYHFNFRLHSFDGAPLAASYYRSKQGSAAPVVMLIHESGRSRKDFEEPVLELKGQGLAEHLQELGYAVLSLDLRGQGQNTRRALAVSDRPRLVEDLQASYYFLVDRHNRGELNLAKLGVIALGDGANLVAAWAYQPGAAVTTEGRPSDLSALALISPKPEGAGYVLRHVMASVAPRIPLLLIAGENDQASKDAVQASRPLVERARLNKVELYPSSLHGYKLLRLEPSVTSTLFHFLDTSLKGRAVDWEPVYNLLPVTFSDIQTVRHTRSGDVAKPDAKPKGKAQEAGAPVAKAKAENAQNFPDDPPNVKPARPVTPQRRPANPE
jgi:alpha-beta hydrolase superfamily lysophospholipase